MKRSRRVVLTMMGTAAVGAVSMGFVRPATAVLMAGQDRTDDGQTTAASAMAVLAAAVSRAHGHGHGHGGHGGGG